MEPPGKRLSPGIAKDIGPMSQEESDFVFAVIVFSISDMDYLWVILSLPFVIISLDWL